MDIQSNLKEIRAQLPPQVSLVAVSKFHPNEAILTAYETGQRIFGESKEQELSKKQASLPAEAVEVTAAASLEGDGDRQRRSDDQNRDRAPERPVIAALIAQTAALHI